MGGGGGKDRVGVKRIEATSRARSLDLRVCGAIDPASWGSRGVLRGDKRTKKKVTGLESGHRYSAGRPWATAAGTHGKASIGVSALLYLSSEALRIDVRRRCGGGARPQENRYITTKGNSLRAPRAAWGRRHEAARALHRVAVLAAPQSVIRHRSQSF